MKPLAAAQHARNDDVDGSSGERDVSGARASTADDDNAAEARRTKTNGDDGDDDDDDARWTANYGALVLFFEANGHADVPATHPGDGFRGWVAEQRSRYEERTLDESRMRKLSILFNDHLLRPSTARGGSPPSYSRVIGERGGVSKRCGRAGCRKYAAFNGRCHKHFEQDPPPRGRANKKRLRNNDHASESGATGAATTNATGAAAAPNKVLFPLVGLRRRKNGNYDVNSRHAEIQASSMFYLYDTHLRANNSA